MKPFLPVLILAAACGAAHAGELQSDIEARWRGAWVITGVDTSSDCMGFYNDNDINGRMVSGRGRRQFKAGELARVDGVDLKRSRLDLRLTLVEPVLMSRQDGPFTLYDEARCRMNFQVELPREVVKHADPRSIEAYVMPILQRHAAEDQARASANYNGRECEPLPPDYDRTLQKHAAWKAKNVNDAVQASIFKLVDETSRIPDRINDDPDYMSGFVKGVEAGRAARVSQCSDLIAVGNAPPPPVRDRVAPAANTSPADRMAAERQAHATRGYQDGMRLTLGVDAVRRLPGCFVRVPGEDDAPAR
jgi:hypothetical protein